MNLVISPVTVNINVPKIKGRPVGEKCEREELFSDKEFVDIIPLVKKLCSSIFERVLEKNLS